MTVDVALEILLSLRLLDHIAFLSKLFQVHFNTNLIRMHRPQSLNMTGLEFTVR